MRAREGRSATQFAQIPVDEVRDVALADQRVGTRFVARRGDARLLIGADAPVLKVGDVPDRQQPVEGVVLAFDRVAVNEPVTAHQRAVGPQRRQPRGGGIVAIGVLPEVGEQGRPQRAAVPLLDVSHQPLRQRFAVHALGHRTLDAGRAMAAKGGTRHGRCGVAFVEAQRAEPGVGAADDRVHRRLLRGVEHRHVALHVVGGGIVFLVVGRAVVALAVVLEDDLPVRLDHVVDLVRDLGPRNGVRRHLAADGGQRLREVRRIVGQRDEEQSCRVLERDRLQAEFAPVNAELLLAVENQRPVQLVGPAVIGADHAVAIAVFLAAQDRSAVATHIVEGADDAVAAAHDQHLGVTDLPGQEVAGLGHLEAVADENPVPVENPLQIGLEHRRVGVERPGQRPPVAVPGDKLSDLGRQRRAGERCDAIHIGFLRGPFSTMPALPHPSGVLRFCDIGDIRGMRRSVRHKTVASRV